MAFNFISSPYIPWYSVLGVLGAGIGYLASGLKSGQEGMYPAMIGLIVGAFAGMIVRIVFRRLNAKQIESDQSSPGDESKE